MYTTVTTADNHSMTKKSSVNTTIRSKSADFKESLSRALYVDRATGQRWPTRYPLELRVSETNLKFNFKKDKNWVALSDQSSC